MLAEKTIIIKGEEVSTVKREYSPAPFALYLCPVSPQSKPPLHHTYAIDKIPKIAMAKEASQNTCTIRFSLHPRSSK